MITRAGSMLALVGAIFFASPVPGIDSSATTDKATLAMTVDLDHDDGDVIGDRGVTYLCPGPGNCCVANGTPGCDDFECCDSICFWDPICCEDEWDEICAGHGVTYCPWACGGNPCPGEGDCCVANWTPACDNEACCNTVCDYDPPCCNDEWDVQCAGEAENLCGDLCIPPPDCPGEGDCCEANGTPACDNACCCEVVCAENRSCCDTAWDAGCAADAEALCPGWCSPPLEDCPGEGDCFAANFSPGCENEFCCSLVCAADSWCCDQEWDYTCADIAADLCDCPEARCPGEGGPCCQANGTTGCDDFDCCRLVCADHPACCNPDSPDGWDASCVQTAEDLCGNLCACASFADFDDNGDVDLADFAKFQNCFTGSEAGPVADGCACANSGEDQDVDLTDFTAFLAVFDPS